jgi:phosphoenolpyruvate carboxykinase (GTP)
VLKWILERVEGKGSAEETPIGYVPSRTGLTLDGIKVSPEAMQELLSVNPDDWAQELADSREFLQKFGDRLPNEIRQEHDKLTQRFSQVATSAR